MPNDVLIAIISGLCVAIPTLVTTLITNAKNNALQDERIRNIQEQIINLTKQVEKINDFGRDLAELKVRVEILEKHRGA